jgi:hypothetical protein
MRQTEFVSAALTGPDFDITFRSPMVAKSLTVRAIDFFSSNLLTSTYLVMCDRLPIDSAALCIVSNSAGITGVKFKHNVTGQFQGLFHFYILDAKTYTRPALTSGHISIVLEYED